ncbi:hypothetical protein [Foetidibacter luteolus]|uniref:hypothetical protein n=1 Tax=Foetidibacter luteolus TaxID=2608880 RepID=UPI00129AB9D9|nr:hypothetical protein [Foetidibacter luteolus]
MNSLRSVTRFIELSGITVEYFEKMARIEPGTIEVAQQRETELRNIEVLRIIARFGPALMNRGFSIIPLKDWPGEHNDYVIVENEINRIIFGEDE